MDLVVGNFSFSETDDTDFGTGKPELSFFNGSLDGLNFATTFGSDSYFDSLFDFFEGQDNSFDLITGTWELTSFSTTPVPVPATVWLFGSGLVGLVSIARHKHI